MRARATTKVVPLHHALEALTLRRANHIHQLANLEHRCIELLANLHPLAPKRLDLAQHLKRAKPASWALALWVALCGARVRFLCRRLHFGLVASLGFLGLGFQARRFSGSSLCALLHVLLHILLLNNLFRLSLFLFTGCFGFSSLGPRLSARLCLGLLLLAALSRKLCQRMP